MKNPQKYSVLIATAFILFSVNNAMAAQQIPPAPNAMTKDLHYQKCLNRALLTRETIGRDAHQKFNLTVEPQRAALAKAGKPFSGWFAWLNIFRHEDVANFERLNKEYVQAIEKATPAKDAAIKNSDIKFTSDQKFCLEHQDAVYEWSPEDQQALDKLIPPRQ